MVEVGMNVISNATGDKFVVVEKPDNRDGFRCRKVDSTDTKIYYFFESEITISNPITENRATWQTNSVSFVQWKGNNIEEVKEFVGKEHKIYTPIDESKEIYVHGIGIVREQDYLCKNENYAYNPIQILSWKVFPRLINEDIGSGLIV